MFTKSRVRYTSPSTRAIECETATLGPISFLLDIGNYVKIDVEVSTSFFFFLY
jgi:hypothetical protein